MVLWAVVLKMGFSPGDEGEIVLWAIVMKMGWSLGNMAIWDSESRTQIENQHNNSPGTQKKRDQPTSASPDGN